MLVREGEERNDTIDLGLACSLAAIAGALNAAAFYAAGFFAANMTGNVSALSDEIALGRWREGTFYLVIVLAFVLGATGAALVVGAGRRRRVWRIYAYAILAEAAALAGLGGADLWLLVERRVPVVVLGLAFLMGFQNAVGTRISSARVRTTHVSGMATDIGIGLAVMLDAWRGHETAEAAARNRSRLVLHVATVVSFLGGGIGGVLLYRAVGGGLLLVCAGALAIIGTAGIVPVRRRSPGEGDEFPTRG